MLLPFCRQLNLGAIRLFPQASYLRFNVGYLRHLTHDCCVIGLGYIGLPTAAVYCSGHIVTGVDINPQVVDTINKDYPHCRT